MISCVPQLQLFVWTVNSYKVRTYKVIYYQLASLWDLVCFGDIERAHQTCSTKTTNDYMRIYQKMNIIRYDSESLLTC